MNIFRCRECGQPIKAQSEDDDIRVFHGRCYTKFLQQFKEYGIRIGIREHGRKRLPKVNRTLSGSPIGDPTE